MINGKFNVVLVLILVLAILTPNLVYAGNLTGPWSGSVSGGGRSAVVTSQAGNVTVTGVVTTSGNARWGVADSSVPGSAPFSNGKLNTNNFWSNPSAHGHTSLQSSYWWDISPDSVGTNIDRSGDDKGTGYITFYFSKPVVNPVLDLDRMGGDGRVSNKATTNSAILTLLNSDLSLTKLSGNSQFQVTSKTIERTPNQKFSQFNQEASWAANSAGAGSVMIKGIISSVSFKWTGTGIEGMGQDGIELVWDLTEYVDNTSPVVTSSLNRNMVRSGDNLTVNAQSSADTSYIVANVMGNLYSMNKGSGNNWNLNFTVPDAADGVYNVLLSAFDGMGNMGTSIMNFTVDNTAPTINATCNPVLTRTGNSVLVNATADDDTASMTLEVLGTIYNMIKDPNNNWIFNYTVPKLTDGTYDIILTATDALGNTGNTSLNFTVDNTPPTPIGELNQTTTRTGDNLTLNVSADNDTDTLTATILGDAYNLTKGTGGFWTLNYTVPRVADGLYTILLTGTDVLGNMGNTSLNFTVDNTAPSIKGSVLPGLTKTGNSVLVKAVSDPDTVRMTATILGTTYAMIQGPDGIWTLQYTVPQVMDGFLQVFLDAWDDAGNHGFNTTNMSVDNALPGVNCTVLPGRIKNGGNVMLRVCADPDVVNVTAFIAGNHYNLTQNSDGTWTLNYPIQGLADGFQTVLLTATNGLGSQGTAYTGFTVDNTAPALKVEVLPFTVREGGKLFVRVYSDVDAVVVTAEILGKTYNLIKCSNSIWTLTYTVPGLKDGNYNVMLRGWDDLNNTNNTTVAFKVQNPVTPINHGSSGGFTGSSTSTVHSASQGYSNGVHSVQGGSSGSAVAVKVVSPIAPVGGGLSAISSSSSGLLDGFLDYASNSLDCNVQGSIYGSYAKFIENPFSPLFYQFYIQDKLMQAAQKAWSTGNFWDFWNYNFYHIYGYSNLDHVWGGENIKWLLYWGFGVEQNGDMSVGNFLLNVLAIIPIGRAGTILGKALSGLLSKTGIKIGFNFGKNFLRARKFFDNLAKKFGFFDLKRWKEFVSVVGDVLFPNPVGWFVDASKALGKLVGSERLVAIATAFGNFEFRRGLGDLGKLLVSPDPLKKVWENYGELGAFLNRNLNYLIDSSKSLIDSSKKVINKAVNTAKTGFNKVMTKITNTVRQVLPKVVTKVKTTIKKVVNKVKKTVKKVVNKVKKVVKTVKRVIKKVVHKVKKVVKKVVKVVKKVVAKVKTTVKKVVTSTVNWIKSKWPW